MSWRDEQKELLAEKLYQVAIDLFKKQGYEQTTIEHIAKAAGVAKGTFFNYYKSKAAILLRWYQNLTLDALTKTNASQDKGVECLLQLANALVDKAVNQPELWSLKTRYVFTDLQLMHEEKSLDSQIKKFFLLNIEHALKEEQLTTTMPHTKFTDLFADLLLTTITGTAHSWVVEQHQFDLRDAINTRLNFLIQSVSEN